MQLFKMQMFFLMLLIVATCACSCTNRAFGNNGYTVIRNRLRLGPRPLAYPSSNGVIRVAAERGRLPADLVIHDFSVTSGTITFQGEDGALRLLNGNRLEVSKDGYETRVFNLGVQAVVMPLMDGKYVDNKQSMQFQRVILPAQAEALERNVGKSHYWGMSPSLISSYSNSFYWISIPYIVSPDFNGDMGEATIESNWYDY